MKTISQLKKIEDAYLAPTAEAAAGARDGDALGATMAMIGPAFADARAIASERQQIADNINLSATGRESALAALDVKCAKWGADHLAKLHRMLATVRTEAVQTIDAADRGLEPTLDGKSHVLRDHTVIDHVQVALDGEARAYWRTLEQRKVRELYRQWVIEDDRRSRVLENDPTGVLLSALDREWARQWRIDHSPLLPKLKIKRAQERTLALTIGSLQMEFGTPVAEVASA